MNKLTYTLSVVALLLLGVGYYVISTPMHKQHQIENEIAHGMGGGHGGGGGSRHGGGGRVGGGRVGGGVIHHRGVPQGGYVPGYGGNQSGYGPLPQGPGESYTIPVEEEEEEEEEEGGGEGEGEQPVPPVLVPPPALIPPVVVAPEGEEEEEGEGELVFEEGEATINIPVFVNITDFLDGEASDYESSGYSDSGWPQLEPPISQMQQQQFTCQPKGCFKTTRGILRLNVKGNKATGKFRDKTLSGKFKGNILVGVWKKPKKGKHPAKSGPFQMAFQDNCKGFIGVWGNKKDKKLSKPWTGHKIKCPKISSKHKKPKKSSDKTKTTHKTTTPTKPISPTKGPTASVSAPGGTGKG